MLNEEKEELLNDIIPKAVLKAIEEESKHAIIKRIFNHNIIPITRYPFRIGREARVEYIDGEVVLQERHSLSGQEPNNDVYLFDNGKFLQISREHCSILYDAQKKEYVLEERGSACGSAVNDVRIGTDEERFVAPLHDGDIITLGTKESKFRFKFITFDDLIYK